MGCGGVVGGVAARMTGEESGSSAGEAGLLFTESGTSFTESVNMALGRVLGGVVSSGAGIFGGNATSFWACGFFEG